jgi:hypothetical protein
MTMLGKIGLACMDAKAIAREMAIILESTENRECDACAVRTFFQCSRWRSLLLERRVLMLLPKVIVGQKETIPH